MRLFVCKTIELLEGAQKSIRMGRQSVLVLNYQGQFYALRNLCTHDSYALEGGHVEDGKIKCEAHGATFNLETGAATLPAVKAVRLYKTVLEGDDVYVEEL
jgi:3-phenylpropionate/trans-cinnamate dioxygenase ferredoxin component